MYGGNIKLRGGFWAFDNATSCAARGNPRKELMILVFCTAEKSASALPEIEANIFGRRETKLEGLEQLGMAATGII